MAGLLQQAALAALAALVELVIMAQVEVVDQETACQTLGTHKEKLVICSLVLTALMDLRQQLLTLQECDTAAVVVVVLEQTQKT